MKALDVAAFLLRRHGAMNAMKLQKLVYYSQAWFLVEHDTPLFPDEIQAWAYGPVVYAIYKVHRGALVVQEVPEGNPAAVEEDPAALRVVEAVWDEYGKFGSAELSRLTHGEAPWRDARREPEGEIGRSEIAVHAIRAFYATQPRIAALRSLPSA